MRLAFYVGMGKTGTTATPAAPGQGGDGLAAAERLEAVTPTARQAQVEAGLDQPRGAP